MGLESYLDDNNSKASKIASLHGSGVCSLGAGGSVGERSCGSNGNGKSSSYPIGRHKVLRRRSLGTVIIPDETIIEIRKGRRPGNSNYNKNYWYSNK